MDFVAEGAKEAAKERGEGDADGNSTGSCMLYDHAYSMCCQTTVFNISKVEGSINVTFSNLAFERDDHYPCAPYSRCACFKSPKNPSKS